MPANALADARSESDCLTLPSDDPWVCRTDGLVMDPRVVKVTYRFFSQGLFKEDRSKGIWALLLCGAPGTGKTTQILDSANRLARTTGKQVKVLRVECSAVFNEALGATAKAVDAVFDRAITLRLAGYAVIILLDDIDGACPSRSRLGNGDPADTKQAIVSWLAGMDRLSGQPGIVVAATCNLPEQLDPAIIDRFGPVLHVSPPDLHARARILLHYLGERSRVNDDDPVELENVAHRVEGWSGRALMQRLIQTSTLLSGKPPVELSCTDLNNALDILSGESK
jgi:SpoVK/Ycf46/Vps4 family AAA+-type ATPase